MKNISGKIFLLLITLSIFIIGSNIVSANDTIEDFNKSFAVFQNIEPASGHAENKMNAPAPYCLNAGDHLRIFVFGAEDLTGDFRVDSKGKITIPLIGEVKAEGLTKLELQKLITQKLIDGDYYNNPKVTVAITALQPFYILGEVKKPGSYEYQPELNVFKAIATAGGYTPRASKGNVIIIRKVHGEKVKIKANEDTPIIPGDSIKVIKRRFF